MDYSFPLGIAKDEYFCNRVSETAHLIHNIKSCTHTVLVSPRRYGKTSLAYRAIDQCEQPFVKIDLYMSTNHKDIEKAIIKGINSVIAQVTGVTEKILASIKGYVKSLKTSLEMGSEGIKLVLESSADATTSESICEALQILNTILEKKEQKCVLLLDEFQEVERIASNQGIEGAIRHVAQETKHIAMIFSGSKRNLLKSMFNDRNKPLYRLCDEIVLERIKDEDYHGFVNKFAKKKWGKLLTIDVFQQLVDCTERHPYYFNALLRNVFFEQPFPTQESIIRLWLELAERKRNDLLSETRTLTVTHKKLLVAIAHGKNEALTSKAFLSETKLASSSVVRGLEELLNEDYIEKIGDHYELVDPLLKTVIKQL